MAEGAGNLFLAFWKEVKDRRYVHRGRPRGLHIGVSDLFVYFLSMHRYFLRGRYAKLDLFAFDRQHGDGDRVPDYDAFIRFAS